MSFFLYGNPFNFYFSHIIDMMTRVSVAFCIMTAFAVFAASASAKKAKADADADKAKADADKVFFDNEKAKNNEIANLKTELSKLQTELAEAKAQHRSEVDDIHTRRQTQFNQLLDLFYKLDAQHKTTLAEGIYELGIKLAEAKGQHRTEVDDIRTRRQTQYIQIVDALCKLDAKLVDTLRKRGFV